MYLSNTPGKTPNCRHLSLAVAWCVDTVGFFGLAAALLGAGVVVFSLSTGRVPARWPRPPFYRSAEPFGFWLMLCLHAVGAIMGGFIAGKFIG